MSYYNQPYSFLAVFANPQDVTRIDKAIESQKLGYEKIGNKTYLVFLFDTPIITHNSLKSDFGITGEIHWIQLPYADITK